MSKDAPLKTELTSEIQKLKIGWTVSKKKKKKGGGPARWGTLQFWITIGIVDLFAEIRGTMKVSVLPVGLVGGVMIEKPKLKGILRCDDNI